MTQKGSKTTGASSSKQTNATSKAHTIPSAQKDNPAANDTVHSASNSSRPSRCSTIDNFLVIWLDPNINESNKHTRNSITHLRRIVDSIELFTDPDRCIDYLNKIKVKKVFLIISGSIEQHVFSQISAMTQLTSIYVFCYEKSKQQQWTHKNKKVNEVFTQIEPLCDALKGDIHQSDTDMIPISIVSSSSATDLNELDQSFMYSQLLKEILLEGQSNEEEKKQLANYCRLQYVDDDEELKIIDEFEQNYPRPSPIWWYTRECFIYPMLNKALRTQDVEVIIKMGFFIRDLHRQIEQLHSEVDRRQPLTVYRGQGMLHFECEKMKMSKGGLLSFNNFLSTSIDRTVSLSFARDVRDNYNLTGILFRMEINPSISTMPFASLDKISYFGNAEEEALFSMHTVFRIGEIKQIEDRLFEVKLTLTSDHDQQLTLLTQHMREETQGSTGLHRMAQLMYHMGEFDKAEEIYTTLLKTTSDDNREQLAFLHHQLGYINDEKDDLASALSHYKQSLDIYLTYMSSDDPLLSNTYSNIGLVLKKQGDLEGALKHYERALNIDLHATQPDQLDIAIRHNNIALVLQEQGKYNEALKNFERTLEIELIHLPPRHPSLATTYNNIGLVYRSMGDNSSALSYYEKTLEIAQRSLPPNHPSLAITHNNIAYVLDDLHRTHEAIEHVERAVDIARRSFGLNHPSVQEDQRYLDKLRRKVRSIAEVNNVWICELD